MNFYKIILHNKDKESWQERTIERLSFPEAAMHAYLTRHNLGLDWEIISIVKSAKGGGSNV